MTTRTAHTPLRVETKPTADMPHGVYEVIDRNGIYWGTYKVTTNWCGEKFVMEWFY